MTFESLAIAGLSIGLNYTDVLNNTIGLTVGLLNEKNNQMIDYKLRQNKLDNNADEDTVIIGDANMLKNI